MDTHDDEETEQVVTETPLDILKEEEEKGVVLGDEEIESSRAFSDEAGEKDLPVALDGSDDEEEEEEALSIPEKVVLKEKQDDGVRERHPDDVSSSSEEETSRKDKTSKKQPDITIGKTYAEEGEESIGELWWENVDANVPNAEFKVPQTRFLLKGLWPITGWSFAQKLVVGIGALHLIPVVLRWSRWFFVAQFLGWRLAYNLGLGVILHYQSKTLWLSKKMKLWMKKNGHAKKLCRLLIEGNMEDDYDFETVPADFNAWLLFRVVVDIILAMDVWSYGIAAVHFLRVPDLSQVGFKHIFMYLIAIGLFYLFYWAKSDAHRVIRDFAWYWGDFFFRQDQDLVFNGVFQFFPHPMYTVGYSFYYGTSLITRSYTILYMSLTAHFAQLLFLALVETPHIEKIYGSEMVGNQHLHVEKTTDGYFRRDAIVFKNLDMFRSSDLFLVVALSYLVVLTWMDLPWMFYLAQALVWRVIHTVGLGYILKRQSVGSWWNLQFLRKGWTKQDAFEQWKRIYNVSLTMTHAAFISFCLNSFVTPESWRTMLARTVLGLVLIGLNAWASLSTYEALGAFGWFYGDFFIDDFRAELYYNGIYRFLNNPESTLGFAAYYGAGLLTGNGVVFGVSLFCHMMSLMFMRLVEGPHIDQLYGAAARKEIPLTAHIKKELSETGEALIKAAEQLEEKIPEIKSLREELMQKARLFKEEVNRKGWELRRGLGSSGKLKTE